MRKAADRRKWAAAVALELIFAEHPLPMWIFDKDTLRFVIVNQATLQKYGYSREEFLHMRLTDLYPNEEIPNLLEYLATIDETNKPCSLWRHGLKGGSIIDVEMTVHKISLDGRTGILTVVQDITQRKAQESKREQTSIYLKALIENCPLAIAVHDTSGVVEMCNPAFEALFQYRQAEIAGSYLDALVAPPELSEEAKKVTQSAVAGKIVHLTTRRRRKDATLVDVEIFGVPLAIQGKLVGGYGIYQDVRDRKRLEEELRFAQKMQAVGRLAGGIAHDFNNIMGVIQGYSESLLESARSDHPMRSSIEEIDKAARRAVALTGQLLAFSRKQVLQPRVLDMNAVLAEMEQMLRRLIREDIQLALLPGPTVGRVRADPIHLEQVMLNLVMNARDAMPRGGKLTIETGNVNLADECKEGLGRVEPGQYVSLTVSDTGTGMDTDTLRHVFEPFFTTKEQGKGTGLGLATVYGIVKQSGGHIFVTSESGRGTTFTIYLPRVEEPVKTNVESEASKKTPLGTECVLLVEDENSFRALVRKFLEQCGYVVLEAKDGRSALRMSKTFPGTIHLVLTDVVMPNMGGYKLAQALGSRRAGTKILFMSGYPANSSLPARVRDCGVALIQKPFSKGALAMKVREILDKESSARQ